MKVAYVKTPTYHRTDIKWTIDCYERENPDTILFEDKSFIYIDPSRADEVQAYIIEVYNDHGWKRPPQVIVDDRDGLHKVRKTYAREFYNRHHYSRSLGNSAMSWGWFVNGECKAIASFAVPGSKNVWECVFGADERERVYELQRLAAFDLPFELSRFHKLALNALLEYRPQTRAILSYSDTTEGHLGTIYQALGYTYTGMSTPRIFYKDQTGRLRHPKQDFQNINRAKALAKGWTTVKRAAKIRYVLIAVPESFGSKRKRQQEKKLWTSRLLLPSFDYNRLRLDLRRSGYELTRSGHIRNTP